MSKAQLYRDIVHMYKTYGMPEFKIGNLDDSEMPNEDGFLHFINFRMDCIQEELIEMGDAIDNRSAEDTIDSLIDLIVFAMGTFVSLGISEEQFQAHWDAVYEANMSKEVGQSAEHKERSYSVDLIKPKGWQGPDHTKIMFDFRNYK